MERLKIGIGSNSSISLFGQSKQHKTLFDHYTAEYRAIATVEGKDYAIWTQIPNRENHLFDATVGCCVLGNYNGVDVLGKAVNSRGGGRIRRVYSKEGVSVAK